MERGLLGDLSAPRRGGLGLSALVFVLGISSLLLPSSTLGRLDWPLDRRRRRGDDGCDAGGEGGVVVVAAAVMVFPRSCASAMSMCRF